MKSTLTIVLATLIPTLASAADLPARSKAPAPVVTPQSLSWSGFYVGAQAGWQELRNTYVDDEITGTGDLTIKASHGSLIGGVKAGYDFSMGRAVYGVVADLDIGGSKLSWRDPADWGYDQNIELQGSLRARAGMTFGNALLYTTGGLAMGKIATTYCECGSYEKFSNVKVGWTLGAGLEYALTKNWSTLVEYRYSDFGKVTHIPTEVWTDYRDSQTVVTNTIRIGVNYRFK